ncbi:hypothetical protein ACJW30_10G045700 [Castanea mollissima]
MLSLVLIIMASNLYLVFGLGLACIKQPATNNQPPSHRHIRVVTAAPESTKVYLSQKNSPLNNLKL